MSQSIQPPPSAQPSRGIDGFTEQTIDKHLSSALANLVDKDKALFTDDVNERTLSFRLALYLTSEFPDFNVDCEYNRHHNEEDHCKRLYDADLKKLAERKGAPLDDDEGLTVFPDIIVHRRNNDDNLLVIEIKKTTSAIKETFDLAKLKAFREELDYRFAKFIRLGTKGEQNVIVENRFV